MRLFRHLFLAYYDRDTKARKASVLAWRLALNHSRAHESCASRAACGRARGGRAGVPGVPLPVRGLGRVSGRQMTISDHAPPVSSCLPKSKSTPLALLASSSRPLRFD